MAEALTPQEVWEVDLPILNIVARVRQIREYAEDMKPTTIMTGGIGFTGENPVTRRGLAVRAERHADGEPLRRALGILSEKSTENSVTNRVPYSGTWTEAEVEE